MNLAKLNQIAPQLDAELAQVFAKYGLTVTHRKGQVDEALGTLKYAISLVDANATTSPEAKRWGQYAHYFDLPADGVGRLFSYNHKQFKIVGLRDSKSPKRVVAGHNGKTYVFAPDTVRALLATA